METAPMFDDDFPGAGRLKGKVAIITGGDSGIGRAVAVGFAKEGAKVAIVYLNETEDAEETRRYIEGLGGEALLLPGDVGSPDFCKLAARQAVDKFGRLDVLVNNAGEQHPQEKAEDVTEQQMRRTFQTNVFGMFYMTQACLPYMKKGASIINTGSVTAYDGDEQLLDYSATKGAVATFTRSLAKNLADKKIRVNQVAPGLIWTPLIPSTLDGKDVKKFAKETLLGRAAQPVELTEAYIFYAWERASGYISGETMHVNGGAFTAG